MGNSTSKQSSDHLDGNHLGKSRTSSSFQRKSLGHIQFSDGEASSPGAGGETTTGGGGRQRPPMRLQRSASGADVTEKYLTQLVPIERLADILKRQSSRRTGNNGSGGGGGAGISGSVFATQVFSRYPDLGQRLFKHLHSSSRATTDYLGLVAFRQQCERFLGLMDDTKILECYVRMYAQDDNPDMIDEECVIRLLNICYNVAMQHSDNCSDCPELQRVFNTVTKSIFFKHTSLSVGFVCRWFEQNLIRLVLLVHKYCVHTLSTAYRILEQDEQTPTSGIELQTPVLEHQQSPLAFFAQNNNNKEEEEEEIVGDQIVAINNNNNNQNNNNNNDKDHHHNHDNTKKSHHRQSSGSNRSSYYDRSNSKDTTSSSLMAVSQAWLLAGALPPLYSKPQPKMLGSPNAMNSTTAAAQIFKHKLSMMPSHWTLLYNSMDHGLGANRFLHHVLGYRGPTLILLHTQEDQTYLLASPTEWKETHLYTGGEGSCIMQLYPKFVILEKRSNILYLNTSIRGYPKGLRGASDPRKPIVAVDEHFEKIDINGVRSELLSIEVWGCGDQHSRETQLDIKKWQIKEAERQRTVKLTAADWMDHPDRFLLELGGRQSYNN